MRTGRVLRLWVAVCLFVVAGIVGLAPAAQAGPDSGCQYVKTHSTARYEPGGSSTAYPGYYTEFHTDSGMTGAVEGIRASRLHTAITEGRLVWYTNAPAGTWPSLGPLWQQYPGATLVTYGPMWDYAQAGWKRGSWLGSGGNEENNARPEGWWVVQWSAGPEFCNSGSWWFQSSGPGTTLTVPAGPPPPAPPANEAPVAVLACARSVSGPVVCDPFGTHDPDGVITSYSWDWGDGSPDSLETYGWHAYAGGGPWTITLTVTDDKGATDTAQALYDPAGPAVVCSTAECDPPDESPPCSAWDIASAVCLPVFQGDVWVPPAVVSIDEEGGSNSYTERLAECVLEKIDGPTDLVNPWNWLGLGWCFVEFILVPSTEDVTSLMGELRSSYDASGVSAPGRIVGAIGRAATRFRHVLTAGVSTKCGGPEVTLPGVGSVRPLDSCDTSGGLGTPGRLALLVRWGAFALFIVGVGWALVRALMAATGMGAEAGRLAE